ncbi:hypothetical protein [Rhizobacter sp. LjRoot28]|uniref:hypothetical protein n=1 Tax=Rhizobacter sp. LjRoot28 TaxID=3342309 RepID=UPI003ECF6AFF
MRCASPIRIAPVERRLDAEGLVEAGAALDATGAAAEAALRAQGHGATDLRRVNLLQVRYDGTDTALPVPMASLDDVCAASEASYRKRFAFLMPQRARVIESVSVEVIAPGAPHARRAGPAHRAARSARRSGGAHPLRGRMATRPALPPRGPAARCRWRPATAS